MKSLHFLWQCASSDFCIPPLLANRSSSSCWGKYQTIEWQEEPLFFIIKKEIFTVWYISRYIHTFRILWEMNHISPPESGIYSMRPKAGLVFLTRISFDRSVFYFFFPSPKGKQSKAYENPWDSSSGCAGRLVELAFRYQNDWNSPTLKQKLLVWVFEGYFSLSAVLFGPYPNGSIVSCLLSLQTHPLQKELCKSKPANFV